MSVGHSKEIFAWGAAVLSIVFIVTGGFFLHQKGIINSRLIVSIRAHGKDTAENKDVTKQVDTLEGLATGLENEWFKGARSKNAEQIRALIKNGVNVNIKDQDGKTALLLVLYPTSLVDSLDGVKCKEVLEIAKLLIEHGADVNARDKDGSDPLFYATAAGTELLIQSGADVNIGSALKQAVMNGNLKKTKLLVEKGAKLTVRDRDGRTLLYSLWYCSVTEKQPHPDEDGHLAEVGEYLLTKGVDINSKDNDGNTALMYAIKAGGKRGQSCPSTGNDCDGHISAHDYFAMGRFLIEHGANLSLKNNADETALDLANRYDWQEMVNLLKFYGKREVSRK